MKLPEAKKLLVVTDLDGTLLDKATYDWRPAAPALEALKTCGATVALCSSKTRAELRVLAAEIGIDGPLIAENGARGAGIAGVRKVLAEAAHESGCRVVGFGQMSVEEVAAATDLPMHEAALAWQREHDEPFLLREGPGEALAQAIRQRGYTVTQGGRFWHIFEQGNKGEALAALRPGHDLAVALGDSENDRPMLEAADLAIVIPGGNLVPDEGWRVARHAGPVGWNEEVLRLVGELA